ncbi:MAG: sugar ABC transporter substrate-binding protein [Treponemataceae bacterium]
MRKSLGLVIILAVTAGFAVWAGGSKEPAKEPSAKAPQEIVVWMGSWWSEKAPLITKEFEAKYPQYKLKIDALPINGYVDNATAAILAGNPPDVLDIDITQVASFAGKNLLTDITADVGSKLKASDFIKTCWDYSQFKGKQYGMPNRGTGVVFYYNKTMFDDAKVAYPKDGWSYDDLLEMAKKITVPGQKYGVGISADLSDPNNVWTSFSPVLWWLGGDIMNADATKCLMDQPQAIKAIAWWTDLYLKHKVVPEGSLGYTISRDVVPLLSANKVAMLPFGVSGADTFKKVAGLQWALVQAPGGFNRGGGWTYTLPVSAKNKKGAIDYMLWFANPDVQSRLCATEPSMIAAWGLAAPWNTPVYQEMLKAAKTGKALPNTSKWGEASPLMIKELQKVLMGQKTPEQAGKDMVALVDPILAK